MELDTRQLALLNKEERKVVGEVGGCVFTVMCIQPGQSTAVEFHREMQLFYCVQGMGFVRTDDKIKPLIEGRVVVVEAFDNHSLVNVGQNDLKLWSMYV